MSTDVYQQCPCGSGKKLKFCCYGKRGDLDRASESELIRRAVEFPIRRCLISTGWQDAGVATVVVVRQMPNLRYLLGAYLVDAFCLGLKNALAHVGLKDRNIRDFLHSYPSQFQDIGYEDARSVVMAAIEYARQFGFEPHEDWTAFGTILENGRSFERKFSFGQDGKPFYIQGPYDDAGKIMAQLSPLL